MKTHDYLEKIQKLLKTGRYQDRCLSSNFDEGYTEIYPSPSREDLCSFLSHYPVDGYEKVLKKIKVKFNPNRVVLGSGIEDLILRSNRIIGERGWRAGVVLPNFYRILDGLKASGYVSLDKEDLFKNNLKTDIVWLANPNSLTGEVIAKKDLLKIFKDYPQRLFLVDEAAMFLLSGWKKYSLLAETRDRGNFVVFSSFSKLYGLSGLRAGFASGNARFLEDLKTCGTTFPLTTLTVYFLEKALNGDEFFIKIRERIYANKKEIEVLLSKKQDIEIRQSKINCVFCRKRDDLNFYELLLRLGVVGLDLDTQEGTGNEGFVRLTVHSDRKLHRQLITCLKKL